MRQDGLNAVKFEPVLVGTRAVGDINFTLIDASEHEHPNVVRVVSERAEDVVSRSSYRVEFPPILDSRFHTYRVEITSTDSSGVALIATKGDAYAPGAMRANGKSRWADLVFQTSTTTPIRSIGRTLWTRRMQSGVSGKVVLALLGINWAAIGFLFRAFVAMPAPRNESSRDGSADVMTLER